MFGGVVHSARLLCDSASARTVPVLALPDNSFYNCMFRRETCKSTASSLTCWLSELLAF